MASKPNTTVDKEQLKDSQETWDRFVKISTWCTVATLAVLALLALVLL